MTIYNIIKANILELAPNYIILITEITLNTKKQILNKYIKKILKRDNSNY